jgi:hypothetical protein
MIESNGRPRWNMVDDADEILRLAQKAVRAALIDHKQAGNPVAVWRDGKVVIIPPEEIVIPDDPDAPTSAPPSSGPGNG